MIQIKGKYFDTEEEEWAFHDGVKAGIKAMCEKYNIDEGDVYAKSQEKEE